MLRTSLITFLLLAMLTLPTMLKANDSTSTAVNLKPAFSGVIRTRYEQSTVHDEGRFQLRTARVRVNGYVTPSIDYLAELDICDRGDISATDIWGRLTVAKYIKVQAGLMRMPFNFGSTVGPHMYLFANRPFVDKQFIAPRQVGVKGIFNYTPLGLDIEGGVYNTSSINKQNVWQKSMGAAVKAIYSKDFFSAILGFETLMPGEARTNNFDVGARFDNKRLMIEGEYILKHYTQNMFDNASAYNLTVNYRMHLHRKGLFDSLSFQSRLDGLTNYSNCLAVDENGRLAVTEPKHQRLTIGSTLGSHRVNNYVLLKLNYEHFFYSEGATPSADNDNKIVAELVIRF